jgi:gliding motility-associated-like protein
VIVTVNPLPTITVTAVPDTICAGSSTTLTAGGGTNYTWCCGLGAGSPVTVTPAGTTTYVVTGTDGNGCSNTASVLVTLNGRPTITITATANPICSGNTTTLTASGGSSYLWSGSLGTANPLIVSPLVTTLYTVTVTNGMGCTNSDTITVIIGIPSVVINASANPICYGASTTLIAISGGGSTYAWSGALGTKDTVIVSPTVTTTYTVTATGGPGCSNLDSITVTVDSLPVPKLTGPASACFGSTGNIYSTDTGMTGYTWTVSGGTITTSDTTDSITVTWNTLGIDTVWVNYTNANGCTDTVATMFIVTIDSLPIKYNVTGGGTICANDSAQIGLSNSQTGISYNLILSSNIVGTMPGTGSPISFGNYKVPGTYIVTAINIITGCKDTMNGNAIIIVNPLPVPIITGDSLACIKISGNEYWTQAGMSNYTWTISSGGTITAGGTNTSDSLVVTWNSLGTDTVFIKYTNTNGCRDTIPSIFVVKVNSLPVPTLTGPASACFGSSGNIYSTEAGKSGYIWSVSGGSITTTDTTDSIAVTWDATGTDTVRVNYANASGCKDSIATIYLVTVNPLPVIYDITGGGQYCAGGAGLPVGLNNSQTGINYRLQLNGVNIGSTIAGVTGNAITFGNQTSAGTYIVIATNSATGCKDTMNGTDTIIVNPLPKPTITGDSSVCVNTPSHIYITQPGFTGYTWNISPGGKITSGKGTNSITVTWNTVGLQWVSVNDTNSFGCTDTVATVFKVNVHPLTVPKLQGPDPVCAESTGNIYETQASMSNYVWSISSGGTKTSGGSPSDNTVTITWDSVGVQIIKVDFTDQNGCTDTLSTVEVVTVNPLPDDSLSTVNPSSCAACDGSVTVLDKSHGTIPINTYLWSNNGSNISSIIGLCPSVYTVTVTTFKGCEKTSTATVLPSTNVEQLTFYKAFSPSSQYNPTWVIKNIDLYPDNELVIVNRWGNEVYSVKEYHNNWDGNGLSDGTYFYYLKVDMCGQENTFKGYLTIIK